MKKIIEMLIVATIIIVPAVLFSMFLLGPVQKFLSKRIYNTTQNDCSFYADKPLQDHPIRCGKDFVFEHEAQYRAFLLGEEGQVFVHPKP